MDNRIRGLLESSDAAGKWSMQAVGMSDEWQIKTSVVGQTFLSERAGTTRRSILREYFNSRTREQRQFLLFKGSIIPITGDTPLVSRIHNQIKVELDLSNKYDRNAMVVLLFLESHGWVDVGFLPAPLAKIIVENHLSVCVYGANYFPFKLILLLFKEKPKKKEVIVYEFMTLKSMRKSLIVKG